MLLGGDRAKGSFAAGVTFKDDLVQVFIGEVQALRKKFAGRLIFCSDDDPPEVEEDSSKSS